jgi:hypothetical protein
LETSLLSLILPEGLSDYFELVKAEKNDNTYYFYLTERNLPPEEYKLDKLESKGFYEEETIRDFPLRGKACFLKVKRRKWLHISTGKIVNRNWHLVAQGTRLTQEFAIFLKGLVR